jgi:hypothetical protein
VSCWFERANAARGEGTQRPGASALGRFFCVPGMGVTWRWKSSAEAGRSDRERTARRRPRGER